MNTRSLTYLYIKGVKSEEMGKNAEKFMEWRTEICGVQRVDGKKHASDFLIN